MVCCIDERISLIIEAFAQVFVEDWSFTKGKVYCFITTKKSLFIDLRVVEEHVWKAGEFDGLVNCL